MKNEEKMTFAVLVGNRGFFSETLIAGARNDMETILKQLGHQALMMPEDATRFGAIESPDDGVLFADFLYKNKGKFAGVIVCLPNFGDETGVIAACRDANVPILVHAYPDELDKMDMSVRRDSFCGKLSVMDVFCQYKVPFTTLIPHVVSPKSAKFAEHIDYFARLCRVVQGMRRMTVGALGARTTAFKTVRFDEMTLEKYGITTETIDLSEVFMRVKDINLSDKQCKEKSEFLKSYTCWKGVPEVSFNSIVKLGVVLDNIIDEYKMDAIALRCWLELEKELKISPCVLLSDLNQRGIAAACELDICNAISMRAIGLASNRQAACLDWNNNYQDEENKCILFHCGPVPQTMMAARGQIQDHPMFAKALSPGCGFGCNTGRLAPSPITYASSKTEGGEFSFYVGEGEITADTIPAEFFGCAGVAEIPELQWKMQQFGYRGYRHHVSITHGHVSSIIKEAFTKYLHYNVEADIK